MKEEEESIRGSSHLSFALSGKSSIDEGGVEDNLNHEKIHCI